MSLYRDARAQRDLNTKQSIVFEPLPAQNPIANPGRARRKLSVCLLNFFFDVMLAVLYCTLDSRTVLNGDFCSIEKKNKLDFFGSPNFL